MPHLIELKHSELEKALAYRMVWSYPAATENCDQFKLGKNAGSFFINTEYLPVQRITLILAR
jgi:hypothetical protein